MVRYMVIISICIMMVVVAYKLYKYNEVFVNDFDDVLDHKCFVTSSGVLGNYNFNSANCEKTECEMETCNHLVQDTINNTYKYVTETSPKRKVSEPTSDSFKCVSKTTDNITCDVTIPECYRLNEEDFCYIYEDNTWNKHMYKKVITQSGDCVWMNKTNPQDIKYDHEIEECRKSKVDCSSCNIACPDLPINGRSFKDNYQKYMIDPYDPLGTSCIPDPAYSCSSCDEGTFLLGYKLHSEDRRFEPMIYTKRQLPDGRCRFLNANNHCHPIDAVEDDLCTLEPNVFDADAIQLEDCTKIHDVRFCCNLDDRDFFEFTKYRPVLSRDGSKCVYKSVDTSESRELQIDSLGGFNCPGYHFRLCKSEDEFRNVVEKKCTPCPEGMYMHDRTQLYVQTACRDLPDCSSNLDICYEDVDKSGTIQVAKFYEQKPKVIDEIDAPPQAVCESTTPPNCVSYCSKPKYTANTTYCDNCPSGKDLNVAKKECDTVITCDTSSKTCLDKHEFKFYNYNAYQFDEFSPCMYKRQSAVDTNIEFTIPQGECETSCPYPYIRQDDKCIIPPCSIDSIYTKDPVTVNVQGLATDIIYNNLDSYPTKKDEPGYCDLKSVTKKYTFNSRQRDSQTDAPSDKCIFDSTTAPEELRQNRSGIYKTGHVAYENTIQSLGGQCPRDCQLSSIKQSIDEQCQQVGGSCSMGTSYVYGNRKYKYVVNNNKVGKGKTCDTIGKETIRGDGYFSNTHNGFITTEQCEMPQCSVDCEVTYTCGDCKHTTNCSFEKTCQGTITRQPNGDGRQCPSTLTKTISCPNECTQCSTRNEYDNIFMKDSIWNSLETNTQSKYCGRTFEKNVYISTDSPSGMCYYGEEARQHNELYSTTTKIGGDCQKAPEPPASTPEPPASTPEPVSSTQTSEQVSSTPVVNCEFTWNENEWKTIEEDADKTCGSVRQTRHPSVITEPKNGGNDCPTHQTRTISLKACPQYIDYNINNTLLEYDTSFNPGSGQQTGVYLRHIRSRDVGLYFANNNMYIKVERGTLNYKFYENVNNIRERVEWNNDDYETINNYNFNIKTITNGNHVFVFKHKIMNEGGILDLGPYRIDIIADDINKPSCINSKNIWNYSVNGMDDIKWNFVTPNSDPTTQISNFPTSVCGKTITRSKSGTDCRTYEESKFVKCYCGDDIPWNYNTPNNSSNKLNDITWEYSTAYDKHLCDKEHKRTKSDDSCITVTETKPIEACVESIPDNCQQVEFESKSYYDPKITKSIVDNRGELHDNFDALGGTSENHGTDLLSCGMINCLPPGYPGFTPPGDYPKVIVSNSDNVILKFKTTEGGVMYYAIVKANTSKIAPINYNNTPISRNLIDLIYPKLGSGRELITQGTLSVLYGGEEQSINIPKNKFQAGVEYRLTVILKDNSFNMGYVTDVYFKIPGGDMITYDCN